MQNKNSHLTATKPSALAERLMLCAEKMGSKRALADAALMSESQLFRYIHSDSEMGTTKAVAIANAAGVDVGWLLTGVGAMEGRVSLDTRPPFRPELMEDILRLLTEILVDFEWRLNPTQRAKYATYAYMALRHEEVALNTTLTVTPERLMEGLWYFGKNTFDELLKMHMQMLQRQEMKEQIEPWAYNAYAESIRQGHSQFYNSTGGDALNRWMGLQVSANSAERLLNTIALWRNTKPENLKWLDVGCGNGRELEYVKRLNPDIDVYGVEISRAGLAQCAKFEKAGALGKGHVVEGEATSLPFEDGSIGMIYCRSAAVYLPYFGQPDVHYGLALAFKEMVRACAPGGLICLLTPVKVVQYLKHLSHLTQEDLRILARYHGLSILSERSFTLESAAKGFAEQFEIILQKPEK